MTLELLVPSKHELHSPPSYHPERPERIEIAIKGLEEAGFEVKVVHPEIRGPEIIKKVHEGAYVEHLRRICGERPGFIDADTYVTRHSFEVALEAASCAYEAAERVAEGEALSISLARPPGHHAGRSGRAMSCATLGFCLINNSALAAARLLERGFSPVLMLDFDLHHGNGTQEIFWYNPEVIHIDLHDAFEYPGTGKPEDLGGGVARGTKVNVPIFPESGDREYAFILERVIIALADRFKPKVLVLSAGFDAHEGEGMGYLSLSSNLYWQMGSFLREVTEQFGIRGTVVVLEGGYSEGLKHGLPSFLRGLSGMSGEKIKGELAEGSRQYGVLISLRKLLEDAVDGLRIEVGKSLY